MYTGEIIQYFIWPVFIVVNWFIIKAALKYYEKRFSVKDDEKNPAVQNT